MGKNNFFWKKRLHQFLDIPIIYHRQKSEKIINNKLTDAQTDNSDFIGPSVRKNTFANKQQYTPNSIFILKKGLHNIVGYTMLT